MQNISILWYTGLSLSFESSGIFQVMVALGLWCLTPLSENNNIPKFIYNISNLQRSERGSYIIDNLNAVYK